MTAKRPKSPGATPPRPAKSGGPRQSRSLPGPAYAGVSDEAVVCRTGRGWPEWLGRLDRAGAVDWTHRELARYLVEREAVEPWWAQTIAVGYEQARGLRVKHQQGTTFSTSRSKTVAAAAERAFAAWTEPARRRRWLGGPRLVIRKATPSRSIRITWGDGRTSVEVWLTAKGPEKTVVAVQHSKLDDLAEVAASKAYWGPALARLATYLARA